MEKSKLIEHVENVPLQRVMSEANSDSMEWVAPVWKLDKLNLNGRVYSTKLAQRIVAENKVTGACDGHDPDYHADYGNYKAICKDPFIENGEMKVHIHMIDKAYNEKLAQCVALGLPIGVSSVGYGVCDQDGVVEAESYEMIRYLDFVTFPAGEVYATQKESGKTVDTAKTEEKGSVEPDPSSELSERMARIGRLSRMHSALVGAR